MGGCNNKDFIVVDKEEADDDRYDKDKDNENNWSLKKKSYLIISNNSTQGDPTSQIERRSTRRSRTYCIAKNSTLVYQRKDVTIEITCLLCNYEDRSCFEQVISIHK